MANGGRLLGVDLLRGLAAYGVVLIHSLGNQPRAESTERFVALFLGFAVPYFLAVSLFLTVGRLLASGHRGFLRGRLERLVVPYLVWTLIFVAFRSLLYVATGRRNDLRSLLTSPLPLLFLGEASAQLYFIPLLIVGELMAVGLVAVLGDRLRRPAVVVPFALIGVAVSWFDTFRREPMLKDRYVADLTRVGLNEVSYVLWCLPFLALALLFQLEPVRRRVGSIPGGFLPLLGVALLSVDLVNMTSAAEPYFPYTTRELVVAFGGLAFGVAVSPFVAPTRWLESLSACTFGIYLMHPLVIEFLEQVMTRTGLLRGVTVTPPLIAPFAALAFAITWGLVAVSIRVPLLARVLYGVRPKAV